MATFRDSIDDLHRDVLHDISYFEQYDLPASPPETPPMKQDARMTLRERSSIHQSLEKILPGTPPHSPRIVGLKRNFSSNAAFGLPLSPPATPPMPSRMGMHPSLARTLSDSVNKSLGHKISYFSLKSRPTVVTIDVTELPRRGTLSRSSSYSLSSACSSSGGSKDPLDRVREFSARSTDSVFPSPNSLVTSVYSPPPNTPATFEPIHHDYSKTEVFPDGPVGFTFGSEQKGNDQYNPFSYTGPTTYPNHSSNVPSRSNGVQDRQLSHQPSNETSSTGIADLEKARGFGQPTSSKKKRHCAGKALICCGVAAFLLVLGIVAVVIVIIKLRHHHKNPHHKRMDCINVPGMWVEGEWENPYKKCT